MGSGSNQMIVGKELTDADSPTEYVGSYSKFNLCLLPLDIGVFHLKKVSTLSAY